MLVEENTLQPLDRLMGSEYFTKDRDEKVVEMVFKVNAARRSIKKRVDAWKKRRVDG